MLSNGHLNLFTQFFKKKFQYEKTATNFKRKPLVLKVKGSMVTARFQDGRETTRDASKFKLAKMATEEAQQRESWSEGESELTGHRNATVITSCNCSSVKDGATS